MKGFWGLLVALALFTACNAYAGCGAIAHDTNDESIWGSAAGYCDADTAISVAISECISAGGQDCEWTQWECDECVQDDYAYACN